MTRRKPAGLARSKLADLMAHIMFSPPYIAAAQAAQSLRTHGYAVIQPEDFAQWMGLNMSDLHAMDADWQGLPPDAFLKDGGRYRRRRHSCFVSDGDHVHQVPHRAHWQPVEYNALHGGMQRMFDPMLDATTHSPAWLAMINALGQLADGEVAPVVVQTRFGFHVLRRVASREFTPPAFEAVRAGIEQQLLQQAVGERIRALRETAQIAAPGASSTSAPTQ